jgi:uncharacterized membrane protein
MKDGTTGLRAAMTGLLATAALGATNAAIAADADPHANEEQCAGVIRAGQNDCATDSNACHGHVERDADPMAWIYVPKGTCERIVGARIVKVVDPTPR